MIKSLEILSAKLESVENETGTDQRKIWSFTNLYSSRRMVKVLYSIVNTAKKY